MKSKMPFFLSFGALIALFFAVQNLPQNDANKPNPRKEALLMQSILDGIEHLHYSPLKIDDELSTKAYDLYLERLDRGKRFLTKADVEQLSQHRNKIDDQIKAGDFTFFDLSLFLFQTGLEKTKAIYPEILAQPFDFLKDETIELDGKKRDFPANAQEQKELWRKLLKEEVLSKVAEKLADQEKEAAKTEGEKQPAKTMAELEAEARKSVKELYDKWFVRLEKFQRKNHLETYINSITNVFDPHTSYFSPSDKESFDINMSGKFEGIGARLQSEGDHTKISEIIPGGPCWKMGDELQANDVILKVAQGDAEPEDIKGWQIDDVVQKIRGKKGTVVKLTIKKSSGLVRVVPITRDVVIIEEGYVKSALLEQEGGKLGKVGYIYLPRFYADFSAEADGRNCYEDVKKELAKVQAEGAQSIVLDLRGNGGGSLRDVVKMSGLFIEKGPIVQVKTRGYKASVLDDQDADVQYSGDLVVLVDFQSASASEILAAALQDYKRAVVVGTSSTYGKGTVQRFIDLDAMVRGNDETKPLGSVKMTIQKFYRINGGTTQLRGVTPDIVLPDRFDNIPIGEKENEYPMQWSEIDAVPFSQNVRKVEYVESIKLASEKRVKNNPNFQLISESAKRFKVRRDESVVSLNIDKHRAEEKEQEEENKKFENLMKNEIKGITAANLLADMAWIEQDTARAARNKEWIGDLKKDVYLEEVLHILKDMKTQAGKAVAKTKR